MKTKLHTTRPALIFERPSLRMSIVIMKKNFMIWSRYSMDFVFWLFMPIMWLLPLIFGGIALVGGFDSASFAQVAGTSDYLTFVIIGIVLFNYVDSALWGAGNSLRWEAESGTLESLYVTSISRTDLLVGASISESMYSSIAVFVQFLILALFFPINITLTALIPSAFIVILMLIGLWGFGMFFAGLILIFKDPNVLTQIFDRSFSILSPIRYPLSMLPWYLRIVSYMIPVTWTLLMIRTLLMAISQSLQTLIIWLLILIGIDLLLWAVGYYLFALAETRTRYKGKIGGF